MLFERFEVEGLAHYAYAVGCPAVGKIAIIDPKHDVDTYLEFAEENGVEISHVLETHIHADYASGAWALAQKTGAQLWLSGYDDGELYEVLFPHRKVFHKDAFELGSVRIEALHTPGHTPEHLSFLVYDTTRSSKVPLLMLSGDFLFVGSLGRPDLLGEEAKYDLARKLFQSVQTLKALPDGLSIHPAHGSGSMCGAGMGGLPSSTLGFERVANPYLDSRLSERAFVEKILSAVPPFPPYYRRMKYVNTTMTPLWEELPGTQALTADAFKTLLDKAHIVVDVRDPTSFASGHIPGALSVGLGSDLSPWAAWVVPYDTPLLLVVDRAEDAAQAARSLMRVGFEEISGYLQGGIDTWHQAGYPINKIPQLTAVELFQQLQDDERMRVIDVRSKEEWCSGHLEGALHLMGGTLSQHLDQIPSGNNALAVICASGYRSTVAVSVLARFGIKNVYNVTGGMSAWTQAGFPIMT